MSFFHLRTVPGCHWPALPDSVFAQAWNAYLMLDRTQWLERAELEERQLAQVRALLSHCLRHVPYYRQVLQEAKIDPEAIRTMDDLRRVPLLPRRTYQEKVSTRLSESLPAGTEARGTSQTSGSSGTPTTTHATNMTQLWWYAFYLRDLEWCAIDPTGSLAAIRSLGAAFSQPYWLSGLDPLIESGPSCGIDIHVDPRAQLKWLRGVAPDYLLSLSTNLGALALLARQEGPIPSLRAIQSFSTMVTPELQTTIEAAFGVPLKNCYSCNEAGYLASCCPDGHGLHVHAENVILEILDADNRPCQPGQAGRVVITHLHNLRGPFLRYELGDEATLAAGACPCGRGLPLLLSNVVGKAYPMFDLPDGRRRCSTKLANALCDAGGHWQHQAIQKATDHVVLRLAVNPTWTDRNAEELKQVVQNFFEAPIRVDLEIHDRLALPKSGKFQSMINEMT